MKTPQEFLETVIEDTDLFTCLWSHFDNAYKHVPEEKRDRMIMMALSFTLGRIYGQAEIHNEK